MADAFLRVSAPTLAVVDGHPTTTSIDVARHFGRRHDDVLKAIRTLLPHLGPDHARNFAGMVTEVEIGSGATRKDPAYRITRDGFTLLAMGFTGTKALAFKLAYIDAFNRMEAELRSATRQPTMVVPAPVIDGLPWERLSATVGFATAIAHQVQFVALAEMCKGKSTKAMNDDLHQHRWLASFDKKGKAIVEKLAHDTLVLTKKDVIDLVGRIAADAWLALRNKMDAQKVGAQ